MNRSPQSATVTVTVGVAQGSILGPLLFIIYANDLPRCLKYCKIIIYAEYTLIYYSAKSTQDVQTFLNKDLESASLWLQSNLLTLNCFKSRFLLCGRKRRLKSLGTIAICINDSSLEEAISFKYLGVILRDDLSCHVKNIMSNTNQQLGLVRRIKHLLPLHARLTLYHSVTLPLFDYGDIIWGNKKKCYLNKRSSNSTKQGS